MTDFTPGPWKAFIAQTTAPLSPQVVEIQAENNATAVVSWLGFDDSHRPGEEHAANARLIAAAPDLLAAVEVALQGYIDILQADLLPDHKAETQMVVGTLDAARRKAKGEGNDG